MGGAGVGYLTSEKDDPNRFRNVIAGGAMGAGIGGLTGALVHRGAQSEEAVADLVDKSFAFGHEKGRSAGLAAVAENPELAVKVLQEMSPEARKVVLKSFEKNWLTRMFGG